MSEHQQGWIVDTLNATGWKRSNIIQYRYSDALRIANRDLKDPLCRAVRIVTIRIDETVHYQEKVTEAESC